MRPFKRLSTERILEILDKATNNYSDGFITSFSNEGLTISSQLAKSPEKIIYECNKELDYREGISRVTRTDITYL